MTGNPNFGIWPDANEEARRLAGKRHIQEASVNDDVNVEDVHMLNEEGLSIKEVCEILGCSEFIVLEMVEGEGWNSV